MCFRVRGVVPSRRVLCLMCASPSLFRVTIPVPSPIRYQTFRVLMSKLQELAAASLSLGLPGDPLSQVTTRGEGAECCLSIQLEVFMAILGF